MQGIQGLTRQPPQQGAQQGAPMAMQQAQQSMQQPQQNRGQDPKAMISQQLIDALAVQRATSQKKQAAAGLQQEAQQAQMGPGGKPTVLQQLEQELVGLNKQEMVQRVMPTMQRKMAQEQQQAQQMPQQAMQQAQQAKQGLAQLQQQAMQQKQQAFRSGGIVQNFNQGGVSQLSGERRRANRTAPTEGAGVTLDDMFGINYAEDALRAEAEALGLEVPNYIDAELLQKRVDEAKAKGATPVVKEDPLVSETAVDSMADTTTTDPIADPTAVKPKGDSKAGLAELGTSTEQRIGADGKPVVAPDVDAYRTAMEGVEDVEAKKTNIDEILGDSKKASDYFGIDTTTVKDAEKAREDAYTRHMQQMKYDETMDAKDKITQRRKERYLESQERSTLSILSDFLIGFGGGTTLAAGMQGAAANLERGMANAQKREDEALDAYDEANNDSLATQQELNEKATAAAEAMYSRTLDQRLAEQDMKSRIFNQAQQVAQGEVSNELKADIANIKADQSAITEAFRAEFKKYTSDVEMMIRTKTPEEVGAALIGMLGSIQEYKAAIREGVKNSQAYMQQEAIALDTKNRDESEIRDAKEAQALMLSEAVDTEVMRKIDAIADDLVERSNIEIPEKNKGWGDAASDDAKPSYAQ